MALDKLLIGICLSLLMFLSWYVASAGRAPKQLPRHGVILDFVVLTGFAFAAIAVFDVAIYRSGIVEALISQALPAALVASTLAWMNHIRRRRYLRRSVE